MKSDDLASLLTVAVVLVFAYLLLIRPARRRAREVTTMQNALSVGDDIMLTSGIFGRVTGIVDEKVTVEIAPGVVVSAHRGAIGKILRDVPVAEPDPRDDPDAPGGATAYDEPRTDSDIDRNQGAG